MANNHSSHREMRILSIKKIITAFQSGATTKNEILETTKLSWGSCSNLINLLNQQNIVCISGKNLLNTRGRKTASYTFNNKKNLLFGMEIQAKQILCSIINFGKEEVYRNIYPVKSKNNVNNLPGNVSAAFIHALVDSSLKADSIEGISISIAGGVDVENQKWIFTPRIEGINNYNFHQIFSILPPVRYTRIEHDIHAQASSVLKTRKWKEDNYTFIHIGHGISLSIYSKGLFLGHRGFAGEIGHIPYIIDNSGQKDTNIESAISLDSIIRFINTNYKLNIKDLSEIPSDLLKDKKLINHIKQALQFLLIVATNILDPQTIIIGGPSLEPFYKTLQSLIEKDIKEKTWGGGPDSIKWYNNKDMFGAFGTILNASDGFISTYIEDKLSD